MLDSGRHSPWMPLGLLTILLSAAMPIRGADRPVDDPLVERSQRLEQVRDTIRRLLEGMGRTQEEHDVLTQRLRRAERQIGVLTRRLRGLAEQLSGQRRQLAQLRAERAANREQLDRQRSALARQVRAAYVIGRQERLQLVLNQRDPAKLSRVFTYYDYLNRARARRMTEIRERLAELTRLGAEIGREERRLNGLLEQQRGELAALEDRQRERRAVLDDLAEQLTDQGQELAGLRRDERRLQALIEEIERALADIPARVPGQERFAELKGRLAWPAAGRLAARFGTPKVGSLDWDGVLIETAAGAEVKAVHHGRVAFADWLRGFGLLLIVDHGDGWMSLYGHNRSLFKEVGDWVQAGETLALVGNSGGRAETGVYFGLRHKGAAVDPLRWCRRPKGSEVG